MTSNICQYINLRFNNVTGDILTLEEREILKKINFYINHAKKYNKTECFHDGKYWAELSAKKFLEQTKLFSRTTFFKYIKSLREKGILETKRLRSKREDQTNFFMLAYDKLIRLGVTVINYNPSNNSTYTLKLQDLVSIDETPSSQEVKISRDYRYSLLKEISLTFKIEIKRLEELTANRPNEILSKNIQYIKYRLAKGNITNPRGFVEKALSDNYLSQVDKLAFDSQKQLNEVIHAVENNNTDDKTINDIVINILNDKAEELNETLEINLKGVTIKNNKIHVLFYNQAENIKPLYENLKYKIHEKTNLEVHISFVTPSPLEIYKLSKYVPNKAKLASLNHLINLVNHNLGSFEEILNKVKCIPLGYNNHYYFVNDITTANVLHNLNIKNIILSKFSSEDLKVYYKDITLDCYNNIIADNKAIKDQRAFYNHLEVYSNRIVNIPYNDLQSYISLLLKEFGFENKVNAILSIHLINGIESNSFILNTNDLEIFTFFNNPLFSQLITFKVSKSYMINTDINVYYSELCNEEV
ncbi:MAG: hypothetical protein J0H68_09705 [Sphingobacteriia bacterium]|nr:hypothetical protein [Sphingobacteriia bacterium]